MSAHEKAIEAAVAAFEEKFPGRGEQWRGACMTAIDAYLATLDTGEVEPVAWADPRAIEGLFGTPAKRVYLTKNGGFAAAFSMALYSAEQMAAKDATIASLRARVDILIADQADVDRANTELSDAAIDDIARIAALQAKVAAWQEELEESSDYSKALRDEAFHANPRADKAEAAKAELLDGLKPFARLAGEWDETGNTPKARAMSRFEDFHSADDIDGLTVGDFRRARTLIEKHGATNDIA